VSYESQLLQFLISGVTVGAIYAIIALGFVMIYNVTNILNFAQGEFVMLGGMITVTTHDAGLPLIASAILAIAVTALIGAAMHRLAVRPARNAPIIILIIVTLGISITIRGIALLVWGKYAFTLPGFTGDDPYFIGGAALMPQVIWVLGATLLIVTALYLFFERTMRGKAFRAAAADGFAARLMGISTDNIALFSFAASAAMGAIAGVVVAPVTMTSYDIGIMLGLKGFVAAVFGGLTNPFAAIVAGFGLGIMESFGAGLISSGYKDSIALIVLLVALFIRAGGFMGRNEAQEGQPI